MDLGSRWSFYKTYKLWFLRERVGFDMLCYCARYVHWVCANPHKSSKYACCKKTDWLLSVYREAVANFVGNVGAYLMLYNVSQRIPLKAKFIALEAWLLMKLVRLPDEKKMFSLWPKSPSVPRSVLELSQSERKTLTKKR